MELLPPQEPEAIEAKPVRKPQLSKGQRILGISLTAGACFGFVLWGINQFLSLRGVVHVLASRIVLVATVLAAIVGLFILTRLLLKRRTAWLVLGAVGFVSLAIFLDWWAPKPITVQPPVESKKEPPTETTDRSSAKSQPEPKPSIHRPKREAPEKGEQIAVPVNDASVNLLREAEETVKSLLNWMDQTEKNLREGSTKCTEDWTKAGLPLEKVQRNCAADYQMKHGMAMMDYQQTYADKLLDMRRRMLAKLPNEGIDFQEDYQNPGNLGGVNGIEYDFSRLTVLYKLKLREEGKINDPLSREEQDELYMRSIKTPKN